MLRLASSPALRWSLSSSARAARGSPGSLSRLAAPALYHSSPPARDSWLPWSTSHAVDHLSGNDSRFPEWIEAWDRKKFYQAGTGLGVLSVASLAVMGVTSVVPWALAIPTGLYWVIGLGDIKQKRHTVLRNFPVLGHVRYFFESIRPEIRQYFIESDTSTSGVPFSRQYRSVAYQRAKKATDTLAFGTRRDVYEKSYEWANHSLWPKDVKPECERVTIGGKHCTQPYSAALLNISAMSYGALSDYAILALNTAAREGKFYHNTGEGGVSRFHKEPGGDIVWNIGTGYFGCRNHDGSFSLEAFKDTAANPAIKMIELKLSQGAKPAHGGVLPGAKVTEAIAEARGIVMDGNDVVSPPRHSAFQGPASMLEFMQTLREASGGKPVGMKLCMGRPVEFASIVRSMVMFDLVPDFITIDGAEGGTGAAPPEFSNSIGMPLVDGLVIANNFLRGAGVRDQTRLICSGKVLTGFSMVRNLALGADVCNSARAMMFALGCIQSLKCNTNQCPTGIATQDPKLMAGLVVEDKAARVYNYQKQTVHSALEIIGAIGLDDPQHLEPKHIMKRSGKNVIQTLAHQYPRLRPGSLMEGDADPRFQKIWNNASEFLDNKLRRPHKR